ncbi:succinate--CoA ligase subunit alpha [Breoghania sp. L-A4]|uniref:succinate--CoA ligase subunit alpha n=1 Tax=Breoghania sp. L-A4 TaxID=2304600 RepID=UPI000E35CC34|nr:succinate--CoA ligase subunit alpha [Breoghania sp. L-A4]AXS41018.1 succinate--CoA ligase subunit alpha [Breoghania sp. L-A4]
MSILIDSNTKVVCQGITGHAATFHMARAIAYGTNLVGGVRPGKGGMVHLDVPVFDTVQTAKDETGANASIVFVPAAQAAGAMIEAIEAEIPLVVCVTERMPVLDMVRVRHALKGSKTRLVGPNSQGILTPGQCKLGVMATVNERPGHIGIVSRSASLTSEIVSLTSAAGFGQSTTVGIGGDPVHGMGYVDCLELFFADPDTNAVVLVGEIGGVEEEQAAEYLKTAANTKPVFAMVVGRHAPETRRMGHAGTLRALGGGSAASKLEALRGAGVHIIDNPALVGPSLKSVL